MFLKLKTTQLKKVTIFNGIKLFLMSGLLLALAAGCAENDPQPRNKALQQERDQQLLELISAAEN